MIKGRYSLCKSSQKTSLWNQWLWNQSLDFCHFRDLRHNEIYEIKVDTFQQLLSLRSLWVFIASQHLTRHRALSFFFGSLIIYFPCICILWAYICDEKENILLVIISINKFKSCKFAICSLPVSRSETLVKRKEATLWMTDKMCFCLWPGIVRDCFVYKDEMTTQFFLPIFFVVGS